MGHQSQRAVSQDKELLRSAQCRPGEPRTRPTCWGKRESRRETSAIISQCILLSSIQSRRLSTHSNSLGFRWARESSSLAWSCRGTSLSSSPGRRMVGQFRPAWGSPSTTLTSPALCASPTSRCCTMATTPASPATKLPLWSIRAS